MDAPGSLGRDGGCPGRWIGVGSRAGWMRVPTSFSFLLGNTVSFTFSLSFSFDPCCPCLQEYIRRQLEEEQRQLEILQQQLLQEQALLLVNGRPRPRLPLPARVCVRMSPRTPASPERLLPCRDAGGRRGREHASIPPPPLRAGSPPPRTPLPVASPPRHRHARAFLRGAPSSLPPGFGSLSAACRSVVQPSPACARQTHPACGIANSLSEGFCFHFPTGTLNIPSRAVCILGVLFFLFNLFLSYPFLMLLAVTLTAFPFNPQGLFFFSLVNNFI